MIWLQFLINTSEHPKSRILKTGGIQWIKRLFPLAKFQPDIAFGFIEEFFIAFINSLCLVKHLY